MNQKRIELPILMSEGFWMNSQLSIARFYGGFTSGGNRWVIVQQSKDLVRQDYLNYYKKLGRDKFIEVLKFYGPHNDDKHLKEYMKLAYDELKKEKIEPLTLNFE